MPWLSLAANGQAALLETNPAPEAPAFDIPTQVSPLPSPSAPEFAPEAVVPSAPESEVPAAPAAPVAAEPYVEVAPAESYVAPEPTALPPATPQPNIVAQPEPTPIQGGCAALLDPSVAAGAGCGPLVTEAETPVPVVPQLNGQPSLAEHQGLPPARQVKPAVASSIPPARRLTPALSRETPASAVPPVIPNYGVAALPTPDFASAPSAVTPAPAVSPTAPLSQISIPSAPPLREGATQSFTVVQPNRYALKPLGRNPLQWVLGNRSMLFPLPFPVAVSSAFGWRQHPIQKHWHLHSGIDFAAEFGTPVVAVYDGKVESAAHMSGYGLSVLLSHQQGERQTRYAHLSEMYVEPGQKIKQGDVIGTVGSTGNSTGPHLHFELLVKTPAGMVVVDPTEEIKIALVQSLKQMQLSSQQRANTPQSLPDTSVITQAPPRAPITQYQANSTLSQPYFSE